MLKIVVLGIAGLVLYGATQKYFQIPAVQKGECFKENTLESLSITLDRQARYAAASAGKSSSVSSRFNYLHKAVLFLGNLQAKYRFDDRDRVFREAGMSIICQNLSAEKTVPDFKTTYSDGPPTAQNFALFSATLGRDDLKNAWKRGAYEGLYQESLKKAQGLAGGKANCLVRHLINRLARAAALAPEQMALAKARGLPSPEPLIRDWIDFHLAGLGLANWIDERAIKLQIEGLPIVCNDLPASAR